MAINPNGQIEWAADAADVEWRVCNYHLSEAAAKALCEDLKTAAGKHKGVDGIVTVLRGTDKPGIYNPAFRLTYTSAHVAAVKRAAEAAKKVIDARTAEANRVRAQM